MPVNSISILQMKNKVVEGFIQLHITGKYIPRNWSKSHSSSITLRYLFIRIAATDHFLSLRKQDGKSKLWLTWMQLETFFDSSYACISMYSSDLLLSWEGEKPSCGLCGFNLVILLPKESFMFSGLLFSGLFSHQGQHICFHRVMQVPHVL